MSMLTSAAGQGQIYQLLGATFAVRVPGAATGDAFAVVDVAVPPGFAGPPLLHHHVDISWTGRVLAGRLRLDLADASHELGADGLFVIPAHTDFRWANASADEPLRFTCTYVPGGFDRYFAAFGEALQALGRPPTRDDVGAIAQRLWPRHGIAVHGTPT